MTAQEFRQWRLKHKLFQSDVAEMLDVATITIKQWESEKRSPSSWKIIELALESLERKYGVPEFLLPAQPPKTR